MTTISSYLLLKPNWKEGVRVFDAWRTGIQKAITGDEKRFSVRGWQRLGTSFAIDALAWEESAYLRRKIFKWQRGVIGIPIWPDLEPLSAQANAAQKTVQVASTVHTFFTPGRAVVLLDPDDPDDYESGVIDSVTDTVITLEENLANTWPLGSEIVPVIPARIGDSNSFNWYTDDKHNLRITAREAFEAE